MPALTSAQRHLRRQARRASRHGMRWYLAGLGRRGRLSRAEVVGMRVVLERYLAAPMYRPDPGVVVTPVRTPHADGQVRGEWVEAPGAGSRHGDVLLYVHGGAFVAGSPSSHRGLTAELSARTGRPVFSLDYRLAPEYPFPAALDDVHRAWDWLLASGIGPDRAVVAGDSAGGHLALALPPRASRSGLPVPAGVVAFSPVIDPDLDLADGHDREVGDRWTPAVRALLRPYHDGERHPDLDLAHPDALAAMPPVLVQASAHEVLAEDARRYVEALTAAGGTAQVRLWPRQAHVFQMAHRVLPAAREALDDVVAFVDRATRAARPDGVR